MTAPLMNTTIVTYEVSITEDQLRARLAQEVMAHFGLLTATGTPAPGVSPKVLRGDGRIGGYRVRISRDMSKDTTPRLNGPEGVKAQCLGALRVRPGRDAQVGEVAE